MKRVVIVEDNQIVACVYRTKLQAEGFCVEVATDGEVGLEMIIGRKPDLALLDIVLPKLTGIEVLVENRFDPVFLDIEMPEIVNGCELYTKVQALPLHEKIPAVFTTTQGEYARHV